MTLLPDYASDIQNLSVYLAPIFFSLFLLASIIRKTAALENAYTQTNRLHFQIAIFYTATLLSLAAYLHAFDIDFLIGLGTGLYIYFSLHYVFIFPLIGICKKSISINILESIHHIDRAGQSCHEETLANHMANRNSGIAEIRENRLDQMTLLKFATAEGPCYHITHFGKRVHELGETILSLWKQKRL